MTPSSGRAGTASPEGPEPASPLRAWFFLVWLSMLRQARAHLMLWIALGLLAFTVVVVFLNAQAGRWSMSYWRFPRRTGPTYQEILTTVKQAASLPWDGAAQGGVHACLFSLDTIVRHSSGFFVFSNWLVFSLFTTFLLPVWSLSFASEGLGRERESRNLIWVLSRPTSRPAIYLAKYLAILPWALALNVGGLWLIGMAAGSPGRLAFSLYWPAALWGALAFCSLFHLLGACVRRPALVAILYSFFFETFMGNMPGYLKRFSISFYTRCLMFDRAHDLGLRPERPGIYLPVSGPTAWGVLAGITFLCLLAGMILFSRAEYRDP